MSGREGKEKRWGDGRVKEIDRREGAEGEWRGKRYELRSEISGGRLRKREASLRKWIYSPEDSLRRNFLNPLQSIGSSKISDTVISSMREEEESDFLGIEGLIGVL